MEEKKTNSQNTGHAAGEPQEFNIDAAASEEKGSTGGGSGSGGGEMNKKLVWGAVAVGAILIAGAAVWALSSDGTPKLGGGGNADGPVAIVNGEEISRADYDRRFTQQAQSQEQQGGDTESAEVQEQIKNRVIDNLIAEELVLQAAEEAGFSVSQEEIENQISQTRSQFPGDEEFASALEEQGFTEETFRDFIADQLTIQNFLSSEVDLESVSVTDEEVQTVYDQSFSGSDDAPALEDIRDQIETQILSQKQRQGIDEFIQSLHAEAEIEILI